MGRFLTGAAATFLFLNGPFFIRQVEASCSTAAIAGIPNRLTTAVHSQVLSADPKMKEENPFARADKNEERLITLA